MDPRVVDFLRATLIGFGKVGARAAAAAVKSAAKDGKKVTSEVNRRFNKLIEGLEKVAPSEDKTQRRDEEE